MTGLMQFTYDAGQEILLSNDTGSLLDKILFLYARYLNIDRGFISITSPFLEEGTVEARYGHSGPAGEQMNRETHALAFPEIVFLDGGAVRMRIPVSADSESGVLFVFELAREDHRGNEVMSYIISVTVMIGYSLFMKVLSPGKYYGVNSHTEHADSEPLQLSSYIGSIEKDLILKSLRDTRGNITRAARELGVTKRVLNYKIKNMNINYKTFRG
jgi:hypothetical protein